MDRYGLSELWYAQRQISCGRFSGTPRLTNQIPTKMPNNRQWLLHAAPFILPQWTRP